MILLIVGVLAVFAVPRFFDRVAFDERAFADETLAAIQYAHKLAIAGGCDVQVRLTASGYDLDRRAGGCSSGAFTTPVNHPSRPGDFSGSAPDGVSIAPAATFHFDRVGRPRGAGGVLLASPTSVSVGSIAIVIEHQTGFARQP